MSELVETLDKLLNSNGEAHWFCPRQDAQDGSLFFDEDLLGKDIEESENDKSKRRRALERAKQTHDEAFLACKILAFDGEDAVRYQEKLQQQLQVNLTRCDVCVREYHRGRRQLRDSLEAEYPPEEVHSFMCKFDQMNITRIENGLNHLTKTLQDMPPAKRSIGAAGDIGMYALFEALNCIPFLRDEETLARVFDTSLELVQPKKLKLGSFVPGMTSFLFSHVPVRREWAMRSFQRAKRTPHDAEVKFAILPFFNAALSRVTPAALEMEFLPRFWAAVRTILTQLSASQTADCLRGADLELVPLSLDHLQVDADYFTDLVQCYVLLLERDARGFWDAAGSASPQVIIEQICKCPALERMLMDTTEKEPLKLEEKMAWTETFIRNINANNIVPPLLTMLGQMLHRFQTDQYSRYARRVTYVQGLTCLLEAVKSVRDNINGGPVCAELIEAVSKDYAAVLLDELDGIEKKEEFAIDDVEQKVLDITSNIVSLEIKMLTHDRRTILEKGDDAPETSTSYSKFWSITVKCVKAGHPALMIAMLSSLSDFVQLEKLAPAQEQKAPKRAKSWNAALKQTREEVNRLMEKLESFDSDTLEGLFNERSGAQGIILLLFNEDEQLQQAALGVLKILSAQDTRRDCLMELVKRRTASVLSSFTTAYDLISRHRAYAPCTAVLKMGNDLLSCLCDSNDGLLRSKQLVEAEDIQALNDFWRRTWSVLETIFENTERWSQLHDKSVLQEFCRETMDFAEFAFDQYSVIANTLRSSSSDQQHSDKDRLKIRAQLLEQPSKAFNSIAKWLRLRDDYLIIKAVSLTVKIMNRLHAAEIRVSPRSSGYLLSMLSNGKDRTRTNLTLNQKAELKRALDNHIDEVESESADAEAAAAGPKKQGSLSSWVTAGRERSSTPSSGNESKASKDPQRARVQTKNEISAATRIAAQKKHDEAAAFLAKRKQHQAEQEKARQARARASNLGAGSGVLGLGNLGKEHTTKGQNVMVSSDESEDDDEDDDVDEDIFGLNNKPRKKIERPNVNVNGAVGLRPEQKSGPTRITRVQRSIKDMRARLAPDLTPLHKTILNWDYFHEGDYPPYADESMFARVKNSFRDPISYQNTFEPLLTLEAWQGMVKSREEINASTTKGYEIKVQNRSTVDSFMEISSLLDSNENKRLGLQEGDIILLSKDSKPAEDSKTPHCLARIYRIKRQKATLEVVYQVPPTTPLTPHMTMQTVIYGLKIQSITPLEREYGALKALQYYDLCNQIVQATPSRRINVSEKQIASFQDIWNLNRAQSEAINAALENDGFSLIQGPPGSGKTKTIVAIVGGLLSQVLDSGSAGTTRISVPKSGASGMASDSAPSKKLLVCAPSNAAVDELVMRLKEGVKTKSGRRHDLNVVRIGRSEAINAQVKDVTMEELVSKRLGNNGMDADKRKAQADLFTNHKQISAQLQDALQLRDKGETKGNELTKLEGTITQLRKQKNELSIKIDNVKDQERNAGRQAELDRKRAQQAVLDGAHVICATLSGSGHDMFQSLNIEFETVIIDEAAQCVEMSSLIPLKYGCVKCIMVGDPKQLPPTVFSKEAAKFQYEQSLFVRMQNNHPDEVHLLDTQYRMHPHISQFPSRSFYDGLLKDGQGMAALRKQPWHTSALLAPYRFYDVKGQQQNAPKGRSFINTAEIDVAMALYNRLTADCKNYDFRGKIGIITPYKAQLHALKDRFSGRYGAAILDDIEFNTTDAFQGRESEVIIFSCVRASDSGGIGFLQDIRRMNVGLTRAKSSLWVLGNSGSLVKGQYWRKLVEDAQARDCYTTGNIMTMLAKPSDAFPASDLNTSSMEDAPVKAEPAAPTEIKQEKAFDPRKSNGAQSDRMEGITYKFEDRMAKPKASHEPRIKQEKASPPARIGASEDVEMEDASGDVTGTSRAEETARPEAVIKSEDKALPAAAPVRANGTSTATPNGAPVAPRKRPQATPFMPRKKPRPGAQ
jgi:senataxin